MATQEWVPGFLGFTFFCLPYETMLLHLCSWKYLLLSLDAKIQCYWEIGKGLRVISDSGLEVCFSAPNWI